MRPRQNIEQDWYQLNAEKHQRQHILEVLLDIRDLLNKEDPAN